MSDVSGHFNFVTKTKIKIAIVYYSSFGTTKSVAESVLEGVNSVEGVEADLFTAEEASKNVQVFENYDGFIWGTPAYFGSLASGLKSFFEKTTPMFMTRAFQNKIATGFVNGASIAGDKQGALIDLFTFSSQQGMLWVPLGLIPAKVPVNEEYDSLNHAGFFSGAATRSTVNGVVGQTPSPGDLKTARFLGQRFANVALQYYK
ncbi:putative NAD(P)H dehydrogenase (quinone) [Clavispora lusitaniae]|uniref:Flavodoxin-like domain-containing protein n=3 Tax=Clavispora lusitaniae TaxID=36911 RepID=C4XZA0_CLAL4|nr:uncharacterized protein CLUG_01282 [Clavispora lusitaniae ATCC 42720]KAF7583857.1 NADPH-dependent FMN reductase family protein [Clavispora lusitaniae]EEQ37159.1 hypothetical protein CLUG_01282 [Clavispora lusitaniae ATCC 42720]OVF08957.1 hypothetical protein A9F13_06g00836 [Clavispora lusitaniae]QFZ26177.1 putative NAD(P)H dehydrogenase (quinone) [Clavispora lusitaniae]QFZ31845.1 putative NAD(P)H dehydrogenase (quinone) [Clavispora lusitaniae]